MSLTKQNGGLIIPETSRSGTGETVWPLGLAWKQRGCLFKATAWSSEEDLRMPLEGRLLMTIYRINDDTTVTRIM